MRILVYMGMLFVAVSVRAQDLIILRNGSDISCLVWRMDTTRVFYKQRDSLENIVRSIPREEIFMIKYADGSRYVINDPSAAEIRKQVEAGVQEKQLRVDFEKCMALYEKRKHKGIICTSLGGGLLFACTVTTIVTGSITSNETKQDYNQAADIFLVAGTIGFVASIPITIVGVCNLGTKNKYKRKADKIKSSLKFAAYNSPKAPVNNVFGNQAGIAMMLNF
jgi:hypothetical protein